MVINYMNINRTKRIGYNKKEPRRLCEARFCVIMCLSVFIFL